MKRPLRRRGWIVAALLLGTVTAQAATSWATDATRSWLRFTATQAGGEFEGSFRRFDATIVFDPQDLAHSRFDVEVATASADTGDDDRDRILAGVDFFAVERWPTARFSADRFVALGDGRFEARGRLTIRDVSRDLSLPFSFQTARDGASAQLAGEARIRRLDYGVGQGEWLDTQWVGDEVRIRFELALQRE